jgi:flagella basal body P-ring formation protein FlgA
MVWINMVWINMVRINMVSIAMVFSAMVFSAMVFSAMVCSTLVYGSARPDCIAVKGERVLIADLLKVLPSVREEQLGVPVMFSPRPGVRRQVGSLELSRSLAKVGISSNAPAVCLERVARQLSLSEIVEAMRRSLQQPLAEIEVLDFSRYAVPAGVVEFPLSTLPSSSDQSKRLIWRGRIRSEGNGTTPIWASVRIAAFRSAVVATSTLIPGTIVQRDQLQVRTVSGWSTHDAKGIDDFVGKIPKRRIDAGIELRENWFDHAPEVQKGDRVELQVKSGAVTLRVEARAEARARNGELVWVSPVASQQLARRVRARVTGVKLVCLEAKDETDVSLRAANRIRAASASGGGAQTGAGARE